MCLHDHDAVSTPPPTATSRRGVLAGAAVLAGLTGAGLAGAGRASAAPAAGEPSAPTYPGRPPVPGPVVIDGATLIDPLTGAVTEDSMVVLADGVVRAAGTRDSARRALEEVGSQAQVIDGSGRWVLPGLVDVHVHANALADVQALVNGGVTSVRSGSSTFYQDVAIRGLAEWAPGLSPRMRAAGLFVSPQLGDSALADPALAPLVTLPHGVTSTSDLRYLTRVNVSRGADVIKTRANPRAGLPEQDPTELVYDREQLAAVVDAAGKAPVLCHAYSEEGIDGAVRAGVRSIEHGVFLADRTIDVMVRKGTYFTPTMSAILGMANSPNPVLAARGREYTPVLRAAVREAYERGAPVVAGTDSFGLDIDPIGGEVRHLAEAGLSNLDALRAATTNAARLLGWEGRAGRLVRGAFADAVLVSANPLEDPGALENVQTVIAQGAVVRDDS